ncbi:alcohol dehydrogenase (NADP+) [Halorientalis persicus]|uniref:Alcohol dehydrogenase (NADP+) n=1 Tax=Halorientalis persicus TaxID=1367881 RepID=A0A1H8IEN9_9EURY|nr:aldo/keto reductase [Halorientalis persicus]SEN67233.1 alcohol dehydrogenase (NADP+) [Halorientalis persicus]
MNCLFVGAGAVADRYAAGLADGPLTLAGVCDTDADRAEALAASHEAAAYVDIDDALAACGAPVVVNLTSHGAHATVTRRALAADRHVYSEKPLALDADTATDLLALAADRDRALGCAPVAPRCPAQRLAGRAVADGRLGRVGLGYAYAHVGRVTEWHQSPDGFLSVGPLYDGAVYPLTVLVALFGPVERVRAADALDVWPAREAATPEAPTHVEATLEFASGPVVRLTASFYAPHRSREFYGVELHGDDGSLRLRDAGTLDAAVDSVSFGRQGREYTPMPAQQPTRAGTYLDGVERLAAAVADGRRPRATARRGAHVVAICDAVERVAAGADPAPVPDFGTAADRPAKPSVRPRQDGPRSPFEDDRSLRLPPIGFGCSRYRGDEYVGRVESIATALDAGYRLLDTAELYGNEHRIGDLLAAPGTPDRDSLFLFGKVWNTNHGHVAEACAGSRAELGIETFDCYALHWPDSWAYQGPLERLAEKPVPEQEAIAFPEDETGEIETVELSLADSWANLETVHDRGWARTLGLCNVTREQVEAVLEAGSVKPAVVQVERHPYQPRTELVEFCHERGIRVIAHSPLSAPGLLDEPVLDEIAADRGLSPAAVVIAWNVTEGVVPIPSSNDEAHVVANLAAAGERLDPEARARIATLEDPEFSR